MLIKKRKSNIFKYLLLTAALVISAAGLFFYVSKEKGPVYDFNYARDAQDILQMFDKDWYWLVAHSREDYSADFMLRNRTPDQNPANFGKLTLKVIRVGDKVAAFAAYYKRRFFEGFFLYLAVAREFRRQGYGKILVKYVIKDLFNQGCDVIRLVTRTENVARKLYEGLGFKLYKQEPGFVYYELRKK